MMQEDIVIAPWLMMNNAEQLSNRIKADLQETAREFTALFPGEAPVGWILGEDSHSLEARAYFEILLSTAAYLSHMRLGTLVITEEISSVATSLLRRYLSSYGSSFILSMYACIMLHLDAQLLHYYGKVPEGIFVSGEWHRPWIDYTLEKELEACVKAGLFQRIAENGESFIQLTVEGEALFQQYHDHLKQAGYLKQREQLIRASNFTNMEDYEAIMTQSFVNIRGYRRQLLERSGIRPGMKVLELGCGCGALTLDAGLWRLVGESGKVVATDISVGMIERAKRKLTSRTAPRVDFQPAAAENLPFPDNEFDAVVGMMFLHFTDIPKVFAEIRRVTKAGGKFTTLFGLSVPVQKDFFMEWFQPVVEQGLAEDNSAPLPKESCVPTIAGQYFRDFTCETVETVFDLSKVENVVRFVAQAGTLADLNSLPWKARESLFQVLIDRGYAIRGKYGAEGMKRIQPAQWFQGTVDKP